MKKSINSVKPDLDDSSTATATLLSIAIRKITNVADFESNPSLMAALFSHVAAVPPFGPFAMISAAEFCTKMKRAPQDEVLLANNMNNEQEDENNNNNSHNTMTVTMIYDIEPELVMAMYMRIWEIDQWRHMGHLYVPMDLKLNNVDQL